MILIPILLLFILLGCDSYIFFLFLRQWPLAAKIVWWVPSALFFFCGIFVIRGNWGLPSNTMIALLLCVIIPELIFTICGLLGQLCGLAYPPISRCFNIVGLVLACVFLVCGAFGLVYGWKRVEVNDVALLSPRLPAAFDGYKIAQISDLHLGTFGTDTSHAEMIVEKINSLHPDLIVFTGDLVNLAPSEALPFKEAFSKLSAPDGVLSILGNHDYSLYAHDLSDEGRQRKVDALCTIERSMGWRLLLDESVPIARGSDTIWVAGVQNIGRHFSANKGDLAKALANVPEGAFTVLLSHDPTHWEDEVLPRTDIPVTLAGHTHAMQFKLFGWSPSSLIFKHWGGLYRQGDQQLYVSIGTGGNLPFRFGAWPEIELLTLRQGAPTTKEIALKRSTHKSGLLAPLHQGVLKKLMLKHFYNKDENHNS